MTTTNKYLILSLAVIVGCGVISCGPQKVANSTAAGSPGGSLTTNGSPVADCSADVANLGDYGAKLQTYSSGGVENTAWIRARFTRFPSNFDSASEVVFWVFSADSNGTPSTLQMATFYLEYASGGNQATKLGNDVQSMTWSDIRNYLGQVGISATDPSQAMPLINFVVKLENSLSSAQVMMPTLYLSSSAPDRYLSILIPKFYANPAEYATGKPTALQNLHPLKYMLGGSWTADQYLSQSRANCIL